MKLDPGKRGLTQFPGPCRQRLVERDAIKPLAGKPFCQRPRLRMQRLHARAAAVATKEARVMHTVKSRLRIKRLLARSAPVKTRQPAAQPDRPEGEVAERQLPVAGALDLPDGQEDEPEHGFGNLVLGQNEFRNLADDRQAGAQAVVALGLVERLQQIGLLDADQLSRFLLDVPDLHVRENLERRAKAVLEPPGTGGNAANPS